MKPFTLTIDRKRWRVIEGDPGKNNWGCCYHEKRLIVLRKGLNLIEQAATLKHEILHACYPDLSEDAILRGEKALSAALHRARLIVTEDD